MSKPLFCALVLLALPILSRADTLNMPLLTGFGADTSCWYTTAAGYGATHETNGYGYATLLVLYVDLNQPTRLTSDLIIDHSERYADEVFPTPRAGNGPAPAATTSSSSEFFDLTKDPGAPLVQ